MAQDTPTCHGVVSAVESGDMTFLQTFLTSTLPSLSSLEQTHFCRHKPLWGSHCSEIPCHQYLINLLTPAADGGQAAIFAYIWDTFLYPSNKDEGSTKSKSWPPISWHCLLAAAYKGSISLAQVFFDRNPDCFNDAAPMPAMYADVIVRHGQQFAKAIRSDRYEYIDFMLSHNGNLAVVFEQGHDILRMVVNCAVDDDVIVKRVRFLASRGAEVERSGALRLMVAGGAEDIAAVLIKLGVDVNSLETRKSSRDAKKGESALMIAARLGSTSMVKLLLQAGADVGIVNGEGRTAVDLANECGHEAVVRVPQEQ